MKYLYRLTYLLLCTFGVQSASAQNGDFSNLNQRTICNPVNLSYRFCLDEPSRREAADPTMVTFKNEYYLFASKSGGYFHSTDLIHWDLITTSDLPLEDYAPTAVVLNDTMYFMASKTVPPLVIYKTADPKSGRWQIANSSFPIGMIDPDLFVDDDGRLYFYYGCSNVNPIYGVELDLKTLNPIGKPVVLFNSNKNTFGWERSGDYNDKPANPWIEGAWMTKHNGRYYLQYAVPGTEFKSYCDGVYVSDKPLGTFKLAAHNPFSSKPEGFIAGAGHSSTFQDIYGNYWHISTMTISQKHMFERRLGLFPAFFDQNGELTVYTGFGDFPFVVPSKKISGPEELFPQWMLLSYNKPVEVSSELPEYPGTNAADEEIRTFWSAKTGNKDEWIALDLKNECTVNAIQINYAENEAKLFGRNSGIFYQYLLEYSSDKKTWKILADKTRNNTDAPHDYIELSTPVKARYIRLTNYKVPSGTFAIAGLRVFGNGEGKAPSAAGNFMINRNTADRCIVKLKWTKAQGAIGYVIRYGIQKDKLNHSYQVFGVDTLTIRSLNAQQDYYFTIDAFNENGITKGKEVTGTARQVVSTLQPTGKGKSISPVLFGLFFEDINYSADGGLYAEMVQNRSFEYNPTERREWHPLSYWEYITPGFSYGRISVETSSPVHPNNPHYMVMDIEHVGKEAQYTGVSGVGLKNAGFDGMVIRPGEKYNLSLFARLLSSNPITLSVMLQNRKGEALATNMITISSGDWQNYTAGLTAAAGYDSASLVILAQTGGKMALDVVSLFPEKTFNNRPNGLRSDLAQMLADMKPRFIRFPGGCLVHGDGLGNMYRWKNTIGPIEQRKEQRNIWGYHQTTGLGYYEYFQFCEDIGAKPLPVLPAAVSCQNSGGTWRIGGTGQRALPMEEMQEYIQEVLDLIEWANGPATSVWGAKRAAAGHPEPFNLEYVGIGNEDKMTPEFQERFKMIYNAVKEKHPEITVIGTSGPFHSGEDFDKGWALANNLKVPVIDEHYYTNPNWFISNQLRYDKYDRNASQVYLGEYASWGNKMINAIGEAAYMTALERNGDIVKMASYAPLLAKKNFTQWTTDMIFFDNVTICPTPNYYVQKLFSVNQGDVYFENVIAKDPQDTLLAASCVQDSKTGDIILKMVNAGKRSKTVKTNLNGFKKIIPEAEITVLTGNDEAENTFENPNKVIPVTSALKVSKVFDHNVPAMSLTVIRIKTRK